MTFERVPKQSMPEFKAPRAKTREALTAGSVAPKSRDPGNSRERLMDAAEKLVVTIGANRLTLDAVSQESGISKGGLLYHFRSKAALLTAIVDRYCVNFAWRMQHVLAEHRASLSTFLDAYMYARLGSVDGSLQQLGAALLAASATDPDLLLRVRDQRVQLLQFMDRLEGDRQLALVVIYALDGMMLTELLQLNSLEGDRCAQFLDTLRRIAKLASGGD